MGRILRPMVPSAVLARTAPLFAFAVTILLPLGSSSSLAARHVGGPGKWLVLAAFSVLAIAASVERRRRPDTLALVWLAFCGFAIASALWSLTPRFSATHGATLLLLVGAVFVGVREAARDSTTRDRMLWAVYIAVVLVELVSLAIAILDPSLGRQNDAAHRFNGLFENANELAIYGDLAIPLAVRFALESRGARRLLHSTVAAGSAALIILSGTRAGLPIALVATLLPLLAVGRRRSALLLGAGLVAALALAVGAVAATGHSRLVLRDNTFWSFGGRTEAWSRSIEALGRKPVAGYGFATEEPLLRPFKVGRYVGIGGFEGTTTEWYRKYAFQHFTGGFIESSYLGAGAQLGMIGLLFLAAQLTGALRGIGTLLRRGALHEDAAWIGLLTAGLLTAIFESVLWSVGSIVAVPTWIAAVCVIAAARESRSRA